MPANQLYPDEGICVPMHLSVPASMKAQFVSLANANAVSLSRLMMPHLRSILASYDHEPTDCTAKHLPFSALDVKTDTPDSEIPPRFLTCL